MSEPLRLRMGQTQLSGLEIYVFDSAHDQPEIDCHPFPGRLEGSVLVVEHTDLEAAWRWMTDACNSADDDRDRELCNALCAVSARILKAFERSKIV